MQRRTLLAATLLAPWLLPAAVRAGVVEIGEPAPPLAGPLLAGESFDLTEYRGRVVLVNFYSSYCRHCAVEIGSLETVRDERRADGFEVLVIGVDRLEDKGRVARMLGIYNLPGAMADELTASGFERRYPTPTAFLIDRGGIVREKVSGAKPLPRLRALVQPWLER